MPHHVPFEILYIFPGMFLVAGLIGALRKLKAKKGVDF